MVRNLLANVKVSNLPLAGRLQYFVKHRKKLTSNPKILEWVSSLKIDFILEPFQEKVPHHPKMSAQESLLVTKEVESMLKKRAIQKASVKKGQFLSNLFLVGKKDGGNRPVINFKNSGYIHPLSSLQNGMLVFAEGHAERERLHVQDRPEGCLLLCSGASETSLVYSVLLGRSVIRIPLPVFWSVTISTNFYKATEILNSNSTKN